MRRIVTVVAGVVLALGVMAAPSLAWNECDAPGPWGGYLQAPPGGEEGEPSVYADGRNPFGPGIHYGYWAGMESGLGYAQVEWWDVFSGRPALRAHGRTDEGSAVDASFYATLDYDGSASVCVGAQDEAVRI